MVFVVLILSVVIGSVSVLVNKPSKKFIQILLTFSGAYLLSITILHLLPETYESNNTKNVGVFILLGILIQSILENFSKGIEHGHVHVHSDLKKIPWSLILGLGIHAFFEGIPLNNADSESLIWAIFIHKLPISIVLTVFLVESRINKFVIISIISAFALMSPLGYLLSSTVSVLHDYLTEMTAVIIGIFLHISTIILFETSENHRFNLKKLIAILVAFGISWWSL